jgi:uncharacterized protein YecE (DUF72 family)
MGWSYEDWRGPFYEAGVPQNRMLEQYARVFPTIEIDSTFYGVPRPTTVSAWSGQVPDNFLFSAKAPRAITHERRLVASAETALYFADVMSEGMGARLGALLVQLPPDFGPAEYDTLREFFDAVVRTRKGAALPWVVEFRNADFARTDVLRFLAERGIVCATSERVDLGAPLRYVRLLGTENAFARFDARQLERSDELATWAQRLDAARSAATDGDRIFLYVRNFYEGHSPATLADLASRLGISVPTPPGRQQMSLF